MARVIVIFALMLAITAAMVAITRKSAIAPGEAADEPSATVRLAAAPEAAIDEETESLKSAAPRTVGAEVVPATASTQDVTEGPVAGAAPTFGTAGIDRRGRVSFTGTATPGDKILLMADGKTVGRTKVDASGNWSIDYKPRRFDRQRELLVSARSSDGTTVVGPQRAIIRPPEVKGGLPQITLKAAGPAASPPEMKTGLVVEDVTPSADGSTMLRGKADPGAKIEAAVNGKPAGNAEVSSEGTWSLAASNMSGKDADGLILRLVKDGTELDETNVPYKMPIARPQAAAAETPSKAAAPSVLTSKPDPKPAATKTTTTAALAEPATATDATPVDTSSIIKVRRGDSLWRIARRHLGKGKKWQEFYAANKEKIDNPDLIYPGQVLIIPG